MPAAVPSAVAPVTQVPTGKVKLHQVREKRRPRRAAWTVSMVASANISTPKPPMANP